MDENTAVILDLDKTTLGARGRNDHVIDAARVAAVRLTVGALLGDAFDADKFQVAYDQLNQPEFHPFTADNQDYLAYICLIVGSGLLDRETLVDDVRAGRMAGFVPFIRAVDAAGPPICLLICAHCTGRSTRACRPATQRRSRRSATTSTARPSDGWV